MICNVILLSSIQQRDSVIRILFLLVLEYLCSNKIYDHGHFYLLDPAFMQLFLFFVVVVVVVVVVVFLIVAFVSFLQDSV